VSIREIIQDSIEFTRGKWIQHDKCDVEGQGCSVLMSSCADVYTFGNVAELREVLTNVIINSVEAVEGDGVVEISCLCVGNEAKLSIRDDGMGMESSVRDKIFDPFFSTKGDSGNGLGLSVAYGIIKRHGGDIEVTSEPGLGTEFVVSLPLCAKDAHGGGVKVPGSECGSRVLVVDDNPGVLDSVCGVFRRMGCTVSSAATCRKARQMARRESFDLILSDAQVGDESGRELLVGLRGEGVDCRLVLMSGSVIEGVRELQESVGGVEIATLAKPIGVRDVQRLLDA
jgi:two-component system cell cycle sensor histidine kinase/response regulator CckA